MVELTYAYPEKGLLPICYSVDGVVDRSKTIEVIKFSMSIYNDVATAHIPAQERDNVLAEIQGAGQSFGITL
jgi:hypothetical protein